MKWDNLSDKEKHKLYQEYCCGPCYIPEKHSDPISFDEFDEMMQSFVIYEAHNAEGV